MIFYNLLFRSIFVHSRINYATSVCRKKSDIVTLKEKYVRDMLKGSTLFKVVKKTIRINDILR